MERENSERLIEEVQARAPSLAAKLKPALDLANTQLEYLCPAVLGVTRTGGTIGRLVASVKLGAWLIVLANPRKVFCMHVVPPEGPHSLRETMEYCVSMALEELGHVPTPEELIHAIDLVVDTHGGAPMAKTAQLDQQVALQIFGLLFASHPDRTDLIDGVEKVIAANVCPLHVGLIGKGSKPKTKCALWPLGLAFAPYFEHVERQMQ